MALKNNIKVYQPIKLSKSEELQELIDLNADLIITAAYGQFLPMSLLNSVKIKAVNVHASLLPKYRGGAPIHHAIINGDKKTGITIMNMVKEMDAGEIIAQSEINIEPSDTTGELFEKLSILGEKLLLKTLPNIINGNINPKEQNNDLVTFSPNITKEQELLDFNENAFIINNYVRGLNPEPGAYINLNNKKLKIFKTHVVEGETLLKVGTVVLRTKTELYISAGDNTIISFDEVQPAGKVKMNIKIYLNGHPEIKQGDLVIFNGKRI